MRVCDDEVQGVSNFYGRQNVCRRGLHVFHPIKSISISDSLRLPSLPTFTLAQTLPAIQLFHCRHPHWMLFYCHVRNWRIQLCRYKESYIYIHIEIKPKFYHYDCKKKQKVQDVYQIAFSTLIARPLSTVSRVLLTINRNVVRIAFFAVSAKLFTEISVLIPKYLDLRGVDVVLKITFKIQIIS